MEYTLIPEKDFDRIKKRFDRFVEEITELCVKKPLNKEWLDGQEVCLLLHISKRTLNSYKLREILPYSMIGNKTYFRLEDVEKLVDKSKNK